MSLVPDVIVVGAGIYGVTAALELRARGHAVDLLDPGPLPHPLAASTDISKVIRMEYGADASYMRMIQAAIRGWHEWNAEWGEKLYHDVGVTMLSRGPMAPGGFEYESYQNLLQCGEKPERLSPEGIGQRFPAWNADVYVDGFFNPNAGFGESGRVVEALLAKAEQVGVGIRSGTQAIRILDDGARVLGVETAGGDRLHSADVVVAAGAWTQVLVPELAKVMFATGHPVFHLAPPRPEIFAPPDFVVFTADVANTGWYGFPLHPREGVVKIANHGVGLRLDPDRDARVVTEADERSLRAFLAESLPALADAPLVYTRRCLYCDTLDEHFWIDRHPTLAGLTISAGGSGHGFKFAPLLGGLTADAVEGKPNPWLPKFRWRDLSGATAGQEAARFHG